MRPSNTFFGPCGLEELLRLPWYLSDCDLVRHIFYDQAYHICECGGVCDDVVQNNEDKDASRQLLHVYAPRAQQTNAGSVIHDGSARGRRLNPNNWRGSCYCPCFIRHAIARRAPRVLSTREGSVTGSANAAVVNKAKSPYFITTRICIIDSRKISVCLYS
jgi:hypothetical protein